MAAKICGNVPRQCFQAARSDALREEAAAAILKGISEIEDIGTIMEGVRGYRLLPHHVFEIYPRHDTRNFSLCQFRLVSEWALDQLLAEQDEREENGAYKFYQSIQSTTEAAGLRGQIWERRVHKYFRRIEPTTFQITSLDDRSTTFDIKMSGEMFKDFGSIQQFQGHLATCVRAGQSGYLKPLSRSFATLVSLFYAHDFAEQGYQPLMGCQMTEAYTHSLSITGYETVQKSLKPSVPELASLRPSTSMKWITIFVVPEPMGQTFTKQSYKGTECKGQASRKTWDSRIAQFVLELNKDLVWGMKKV